MPGIRRFVNTISNPAFCNERKNEWVRPDIQWGERMSNADMKSTEKTVWERDGEKVRQMKSINNARAQLCYLLNNNCKYPGYTTEIPTLLLSRCSSRKFSITSMTSTSAQSPTCHLYFLEVFIYHCKYFIWHLDYY